MTSSSRRSGFRLPWTAEEGDDAEQALNGKPVAADAPRAGETPQSATAVASAVIAPPATDPAPTPAASAQKNGMPTNAEATTAMNEDHQTDASDNPFLRNLVDAMRHVAEEARSKSVVELRASIDDHIRELRSASEERAGAMRKLAEDEVAAVGSWEETEIERVRAEAKRRSEERRTRLDTEVADDASQTEREIEQTRERATAYEGELDSFLAKLAEIRDPAAFVTAAQRMPAPPLPPTSGSADDTTVSARLAALGVERPSVEAPAAAPETAPATDAPAAEEASAAVEAVAEQPAAEPAAPEVAATSAAAPEPVPAPADVVASAPVATAPAAEPAAETATSVVVKGLGSFGAITSFKQTLERAPGIRSVALSLGPTGEFVYRATHAAGADLAALLGAIEDGSTVERQADGSLRVTVGRPR
ncbi:MAG: hypothetical protein ABI534_06880 [Chloroflexota bacterium]